MSNWKTVRLGEVCDISSSKRIFANEYVSDGVPFYRGKEIIEKQKGNLISTELFISTERYNIIKSTVGVPNTGDILLTSVGTLGIPWIVDDEKFYFKDGNLTWLRKFNGILSRFLYYWILSPDGKNQIYNKSIGSTQKALTIDCLRKFELNLPSVEEQRRIARILGVLDDKIECNNRINRNLEEQAAVLFRRWFVDFEFPDSDGNPYRSSGGTMQDSPLGSIPQGWQVGTFRDIISSTIGGDWGKESAEANYSQKVYCIRGADITDVSKGEKGKMPFRYILPKNHTAKKLEVNDLVIEISGGSPTQSTGRIALISDSLLQRYDEDMICTNFCRAIKPKTEYAHFIYSLWRYMYDQNIMFSYENGTTGIKNLNINGLIDNEQIVILPIEVLNNYNNLQKQFFNITFTNALESETLATLRDTLLPKLMNNEIKV